MIQELIAVLNTKQPPSISMFLECAAVIGVLGFMLWLLGARYSRQIVALCGVAVGTLVGKHLPEIAPQVNLSPAVLAVAGALLFGVVAFVMHRLLIGLLLGSSLVVWASLATWIGFHGQQSWSQPVWAADSNLQQYGKDLWTILPPDVARVLPWAAGVAMITGIALATLWPRIAAALNWSLAGATMWIVVGLAAMCFVRPQWLGTVSATQTSTQAAAFAGIVLFGALVQWKLAPEER